MHIKKRTKIILGVLVTGILAAVITGLLLYNKPHKDLTRVKPDYTMEAGELYSSYSADEQHADSKYLGKIIQVDGKLDEIVQNMDETVTLIIVDPMELAGIRATLSKKVSADHLEVGDHITIRGSCSGMLFDVILDNCVLVK